MLAPLDQAIAEARGAVGAFTAYDIETAAAILRAAEAADSPVVLLVAPRAFSAEPRLVPALAAVAEHAGVPVCIQLDHCADRDLAAAAVAAGVTAVMADGSAFPYDANVGLSAAIATLGVPVEVELGRIEGDEDVATAIAAGALTEPAEAALFVAATGAACLAVSIGNVHGHYRASPQLDWELLDALARLVPIPLSLHGASGLFDDDLRRAVASGIRKVNFNTELREAYLDATARVLPEVRQGARLLDLHREQAAAVERVVAAKAALLRA